MLIKKKLFDFLNKLIIKNLINLFKKYYFYALKVAFVDSIASFNAVSASSVN